MADLVAAIEQINRTVCRVRSSPIDASIFVFIGFRPATHVGIVLMHREANYMKNKELPII